jgi:hypothetical protein
MLISLLRHIPRHTSSLTREAYQMLEVQSCPKCGVEAGLRCITAKGIPTRIHHRARWTAYDARRISRFSAVAPIVTEIE